MSSKLLLNARLQSRRGVAGYISSMNSDITQDTDDGLLCFVFILRRGAGHRFGGSTPGFGVITKGGRFLRGTTGSNERAEKAFRQLGQ